MKPVADTVNITTVINIYTECYLLLSKEKKSGKNPTFIQGNKKKKRKERPKR